MPLSVHTLGSACSFAHRARTAGNLTKYNVALTRRRPGSNTLSGSKTRNTPSSWGVSCFGIRQRPTLPGVSHRALFRHRRRAMGNLAKYNVALVRRRPGVGRIAGPKRNQPHIRGADFFLESGNVLLSRAVSSQVPSALKGLTSVFGMGTGGSLSPLSPEFCQGLVQSFVLLALAASLHNRSLRLGNSPHIRACSSIRAYPENRTSKLLTSCFLPVSNFPFGLNSILWIKSSTD